MRSHSQNAGVKSVQRRKLMNVSLKPAGLREVVPKIRTIPDDEADQKA